MTASLACMYMCFYFESMQGVKGDFNEMMKWSFKILQTQKQIHLLGTLIATCCIKQPFLKYICET